MKILLTLDTDWLKRNPAQHHHVAERLSAKGHEIRVIDYEILWETEGKKELVSKRQVFTKVSKIIKGADLTVIRPGILKVPFISYLSMYFTYKKEINRQIREFKPDVIIGHSILSNYLAMKAAKRNRIPYVFHVLDAEHTLIPSRLLKPLGKAIEKHIFSKADKVIVINDVLKQYAISMGANQEDIVVIKAGIDLARYDPAMTGLETRQKYHIKKDDFVLFFMGWLYHFSGLKETAVELSKNNSGNIKLFIVGDGDAGKDLESIKKSHDLDDRLILTGKQPFNLIPQLIAAADICILPAYNVETMRHIVPIKMYEYMALGKPVITTMLPGVMTEFGEGNGVLYVDRPESTLDKAVEMRRDGSLKDHGIRARNFVGNNDWKRVVGQFEQVLLNLEKDYSHS